MAQSSTEFMKAEKVADCTIAFDLTAAGQSFPVNWGMDTAWDSEANVRRGINYIGKENFSTGRLSFQPTYLVYTNDDGTYELTPVQKQFLRSRINHLKLTGITQANINCDNAAALDKLSDGSTGFKNYTRKVEEWYKLIKASVKFCQDNGMQIISISPYNEPDLDENKYWWKEDFVAICRLIRADPFFDGIRLCGGNTLNCDRAWDWYEDLRDVIDEGNTHQLAGSFANYANFFTKVRAEGKLTANDELHNVGEAIVGVNYGMQTGIWWGFDSKARGEFCHDSQEGVRIGYGEDRAHWTSGAVYRNEKTGEVHGFLGSSERQANNSTFTFVSVGQDVFFNDYGPTRAWTYELPGGNGYMNGQINAELFVNITKGEDVSPGIIDGTYQIMNLASEKLLTMNGTNDVQCVTRRTVGKTQQWVVKPQKLNGDCSFHTIDNAGNTAYHLNLKNWNLNSGATIIGWQGDHGDLEQWHLKYAKDGCYYIVNRYSNKYLYCPSTNSGTVLQVVDPPKATTAEVVLKRYLWRFQPIDAQCETDAPAAPTSIVVTRRPASISLRWTAPADEDVATYTVLRSDNGVWNTIGRGDTLMSFTDNTALQGHEYAYKVIAVDYAGNRSVASEPTEPLTLLPAEGLICQLQFDGSLADSTANHLDASIFETERYTKTAQLKKSGTSALNLTDQKGYVQLPYSVAQGDDMTIALWVRMSSAPADWTRLFDFGNGTDSYIFLTPNNGREMSFVMKPAGGAEQKLGTGSKLTNIAWKHVAVTIQSVADGKVAVRMYVDGVEVAASDNFTVRPSDIKPSLCYLGRSQYPADPLLKAYIDDVRIYNHALTAEQVAALTTDLDGLASDYVELSEEIVPAGIEDVRNDGQKNVKLLDAVFDLSGRRIPDGTRKSGIYIRQSSDGTRRKVLVK
jgi:hypothetical protein